MRKSYVFMLAVIAALGFSLAAKGQEAVSSPHGEIKLECQLCHSAESWNKLKRPVEFDHSKTGFALLGAHQQIGCRGCHTDLKFAYIGVECADCHTDIHRNQFGTDCRNCHTPESWANRQDVIDLHASRGFPLIGVHSVVDCEACHFRQGREEFVGTPVDCQGCHLDNFKAADNPDHAKAGFNADCQTCHPPVASSWFNTTFQHSGEFLIRGAHRSVDCVRCHPDIYAGTSVLCYGCHEEQYLAATEPNHSIMGFPTNCEVCHNETAWERTQFDHFAASGFEIRGAHLTIACNECHVQNQLDLPTECYGCHETDYSNVSSPNHVSGNFPTDCVTCHTEIAWSPAQFDHSLTSFPLTGQHMSLACEACHIGGQFSGTPSECFACHEDNYNSVQDPNHVSNNFNTDCTLCHSTAGWTPSSFNHSQTQFPLTGAHLGLECIQCHAGGYSNIPTDCYSCHENDYNTVQDPNHISNNFSTDCTMCHSTTGWSPANFDHAQTQFPLTGAHLSLDCVACHAGGYQNTPTDCFSCHENDYNSVQDPNHVSNNFDHDCTVCHTTTAWLPTNFDHSQTQFPLTGAHLSLECIACHAGGYQNVPTDCFSCHENDYNSVQDPNHITNGFDHDCTVCHTTTAWLPTNFDHSQTQFPLTGAHLSLDCIACHAGGYQNVPTDCFSCHENDYNSVQDPNHITNGFDHDCTLCHTTSGWSPANFDHSQTQFPLTGAHVSLDCVACHADGYQNTPTDCFSCHENDFNSVQDPNHVTNGFDHDCTLCHTTSGWSPAEFDHSQTQFPLTGVHLTLECIACHSNGYENTPTECFACHQGDYNNSDDPPHLSMGFPTDCQRCHNTSGWASSWNHDASYFPIFSGRHQGRWNICAECHVIPDNYVAFECILCHEHNQQDTDDRHQDVPGYSYNSQACYNCHPDGEAR